MKSPKVRLYVRVVLPDGTRPFLDPVYAGNHKLKPGWAVVHDKPQRFDDAVYYARYANDTKRVYERLSADPQLALVDLDKLEKRSAAIAAGVIASASPNPETTGAGKTQQGHTLLDAVREYIEETRTHKSKKTAYAYAETCLLLLESLDGRDRRKPFKVVDAESGRTRNAKLDDLLRQPSLLSSSVSEMQIEDIRRDHVLAFATFLRKRGNEPRTVSNRVKNVRTLLFRFDLPWVLKRGEIPKYTKKKVRAYKEHELDLMFAKATDDEADLLHFLLCTGAREQEVQYACWADVDLVSKEYTFREHRDLGFTPKDREEGSVPLSNVLVDRLRSRRQRYSKSRLIFPSKDGKPNGHALRIIKSLALRAGANCGQCVNKQGQSCAEHPVCRQIILHKMRKTYATRLHQSGVPARTIQGWLRHSDLATTMLYLAEGEDDQQTREQINAAFGQFSQTGGAA